MTTTKKAASKKTVSKKTVSKKTVSKKTVSKKTASKKTASKKTASKKTVSKKTVSKKTAAKKSAPKKTPASSSERLLDEVLAFALTLPEAWRDSPWGDIAIKVRKKAFIFSGQAKEGHWGLSVKLPQSGAVVLELPIASPTGYGLGKSGWVSLTLRDGELPPAELLNEFVEESYRAIAPKTLVKQLDLDATPPS